MNMNTRRILRKGHRFLIHVILVVLAIINIYPLLWMVSSSLKDLPEFVSGGMNLIPRKIVWQNYIIAWRDAEFGRYIFNTLMLAVVPTLTSLFSSSMAGYAIARKEFVGRKIIIGLALVTMFLPGGLSIIPLFRVIHRLNLASTLVGVLLPGMGGNFMWMLFFYGFYSSISTGAIQLEDAARIDGATFFQSYWHVMLPLAEPMFATLGIMGFIGGWNSFLWPLVVGLGKPSLRTITVGLFSFRGEHLTEWTLLCAGTTMGLLPILVVFFLAQRWIIEGLSGAIKM